MVEQGYGRIVMTTSAGLFGLSKNTSYAAAKGGVVGLTRSIALAGAKHGIKVNAIAPAAWTRMAGGPAVGDIESQMAPDLVAPMAAFLAHEDCPVSGEMYAAGAGRFARVFIASTPGYVNADGGADDRGRGRELEHDQRRDGIRGARRSQRLVGVVHGASAHRGSRQRLNPWVDRYT